MTEESNNINDLLEAALDPQDTKTKAFNKREVLIREFIRANNITIGTNPIPNYLVYDYFHRWCKTASKKPLGLRIFIHLFKQYFDYQVYKGRYCFKINPESVGLDDTYTIYRDTRFNPDKKEPKIKYKGVFWFMTDFVARFETEDDIYFLGKFRKQEDAAVRYDIAAYKYYGKKAQLNFPKKIKDYEKEEKEGYPSLRAAKISSIKS